MYVRDYVVTFRDKNKQPLAQVLVKNTVWFKVQLEAEKLVSKDIKNTYDNISVLPISEGEKNMIENNLEETEQKESFIIDDLSKVEWAVKKINKLQNDIDYVKNESKKMLEAEKLKIETWAKNEILEKEDSINFFKLKLQLFAEQELKDSKKKSFKVPSGTIGFRAGATKFKINDVDVSNDNEDLIKFTKSSYPDLIKTKTTVDWSELKKNLQIVDDKVITIDGEIVKNMTAETEENKFYVK
ncbi:MAG: putative phage protein [Bacillales bacterium]|jgi:hypothetical protein|nr:putative phage protein [Bacillales bacterium]